MMEKYDWNQKFENWEEKKPKWEPFHGYVREPWPMFVFVFSVLILFLAFTIWVTVDLVNSEPTEALYCAEVVFDTLEQDGPIYLLTVGQQEYHLFSDAVAEKSELESLVSMKVPVSISYRRAASGTDIPYSICSIQDESGKIYVSPEAVARTEQIQTRKSLSILWLLCAAFWGFFALGYYVVCNAPSHPKLAAFLIRKAFRNF